MEKKRNAKRILSSIMAIAMAIQSIPAMNLPKAEAASNIEGTFEGQDADIFSALGFDTSEIPEGYDAETVDNPYGRNKLTGNQVFELLTTDGAGTKTFGRNNNNLSASNLNGAPAGSGHGLVMSAVASGDFDGDGLAGEVAYVGYKEIQYNTWQDKSDLYLCVYDAETNSFSDLKKIGTFNPAQVTTKGGTMYSRYDYAWQNLLQITAGDYDGDGISEIAAYVADDGNCRVDIFKYQKTSESTQNGWLDISQWSRTWSHIISNTANQIPNMVSLVSADINRDGIDDLGIASGRFSPGNSEGTVQQTDKSSAIILWGARNDMLQTSSPLDLDEAKLGDQVRVSLTTGDLDNDGYAELIATGQPLADAQSFQFSSVFSANTNSTVGNTERTIITYVYDATLGLMVNYSGVHKPVDGDYVTETTDDGTYQAWQSGNGFDQYYYSQPVMKTNAAAFKTQSSDYTYLYLDSCMYEYTEGQMTLKMSLDDSSYDGQNTLGSIWGANAGNSIANALLSSVYGYEQENYVEYGAVSADINGKGFDTLSSGFMFANSRKEPDSEGNLVGYQASGYMALGNDSSGKLIASNTLTANTGIIVYNSSDEVYESGSDTQYPCVAMVDVDLDTVIIEYTGVHYLTYSDPEVLAILAAAPYFEDVDRITGYDYAWQNTTSFSRINGSGKGDIVAVDLEVGAYTSVGKKFSAVGFELETSLNYTMEWEEVTTKSTEYTLTFETSQNEDAVAFFSIPTENYVYRILTPDGNGGYNETFDTISNTFTPCYQILTLDYYESIQSNYEALPEISGTALTSTPGDPSSYPASTSGYNVIAQWNDDPAGVSFGNGAISQEITVTEEYEESYNMGAALDFQFGLGLGTQSDFVQSEGEFMGGIQFSLNPTGGWTNIKLTGTTFSGTVTNMPLEFRDYGYYYNWKLFAYEYSFDNGTSIPVVSYVVGDVTEPPLLPDDFQQNYERTTSSSNVMTWTYDDEFSSFIIHKYYDFPVGGGLQEILEIPVGCDPRTEVSNSTGTYAYGYNLKYDDNGKQYKEYYFEDMNLAPYTEYEYSIQVERLSKTPPLSAPSELTAVRTKAASGNPLIPISESDGTDDGLLQIYPDKNSYLTVNATGPDGEAISDYYTTVQYQWQKKENGAWTNIIGETGKTLTFANAGVDTTGEYRCLVNVLTQSDATAISAYTDSVTLNHSKRVAYIDESEIYVQDVAGGGVYFYAKVRNAHADSASIPSGTVNFTLTHNATGNDYQVTTKLNNLGVAEMTVDYTLPEGLYTVDAYYSGSYIFKSCFADTLFLSQRSNGLAVDTLDSVYYGDGAEVVSRAVTNVNGITYTEETQAETFYMKPATKTSSSVYSYSNANNYTQIGNGDNVTAGNKYYYDDNGINCYFVAEYSAAVHFLNGYAIYDINEGYLSYTGFDGRYEIAENTPAGRYIIVTTLTNGVETLVAHTTINIDKRPITIALPSLKINENDFLASSYRAEQWNVVSGSWAECDLENGTLCDDVSAYSLSVKYKNTAGTVKSATEVAKLCGAYTSYGSIVMPNYDVTVIDGKVAVLGGANEVNLGVRSFEGKDVGTLFAVAPDYASTRSSVSDSDALTQRHATGTRLVFTAVPDEGYAIYAWYINGVKQSSTSSTISYTMLNEETTVEIQFDVKKNELVYGTQGDEGGGTITCSDSKLTSSSIVLPNAYMTFEAVANEGYHFKEWRYTETGSGTVYDNTDEGAMESTFTLLMPSVSCSLYAVFERDYYAFSFVDESEENGLCAWYNVYQPGATAAETVYVQSGEKVKGDTQITIAPKAGYRWNNEYNYVSDGSQGTADYENGTYTFTLNEDTTVYGNTIRDVYDLTFEFDVTSKSQQICDAQIVYYIGDDISGTFDYDAENPTYTIEDIPGGSTVRAEVVYPSYYLHDGWVSNLTTLVPSTEKNNLATELEKDGAVTCGNAYWYTAANENGANAVYYFVAPATGTAIGTYNEVVVYSADEGFTINELACDDTLTAHLTEKDIHKVTAADISGFGEYSFTLAEGSYIIDESIYVHNGDDFDVLITPLTGYTVTYWNILPTNSPQQEIKATSLRYVIPDVAEDFVLTPIFAATSYNTISWPTISNEQNFLTLSEYNCVSSVATGKSFSFRLSGAGMMLLDSVYANGFEFVAKENGGNYTYTGDGEDRIYTINNVSENYIITVSLLETGVCVNGIDVSALKGSGWYYDAAQQILVLQKSNLVVSGTNSADTASEFSILLEAGSVTLQNLELNSAPDSAVINTTNTDAVITLDGNNELNLTGYASAVISASEGNLTLRGTGNLTANADAYCYEMLYAYETLTIAGSCNICLNANSNVNYSAIYADELFVRGTALLDINSASYADYGIRVDKMTVGSSDMSDNPTVRVSAPYEALYVYDSLTTYSGEISLEGSQYGVRVYGDIANYGGTIELAGDYRIIRGYGGSWIAAYAEGYAITYLDSSNDSKFVPFVNKSDYSNSEYDLFAYSDYINWKSSRVGEKGNFLIYTKSINTFKYLRLSPIPETSALTMNVVIDNVEYSTELLLEDELFAQGYYYADKENGVLEFIPLDSVSEYEEILDVPIVGGNTEENESDEDTENTEENEPVESPYILVAKADNENGLVMSHFAHEYENGSIIQVKKDSSVKFDYTLSGTYTGNSIIVAENDFVNSLTLDNTTLKDIRISEVDIHLCGNCYIVGSLDLDENDTDEIYDLELYGETDDATFDINSYSYSINAENETLKFGLFNVRSLKINSNYSITNSGQSIDICYCDSNGNMLPYGTGWETLLGSASANATVQSGNVVNTNGSKYMQVYRKSADAVITPSTIVFDIINGIDNIEGVEDVVIQITEPIDDGNLQIFDKQAQSETEQSGYIVLIDSQGNETQLYALSGEEAIGDYIFTRSQSVTEASILTILSDTFSALESGRYTIRIVYYDDDINDTEHFYNDITLIITDVNRITGEMSISPSDYLVGRGEAISFESGYTGTAPNALKWILEGAVSENTVITETSNGAKLEIGADEPVGNHITVTVIGYADESMTNEIGFAVATVNVISKAVDIKISCEGESPSGDESFTLHHTTDDGTSKYWIFDAQVFMDDESKADDNVVWSLWGNKLKATTLDAQSGRLTIAPNETGTNGKLKLTATYTNADSTTFCKTIVIYLSSDVWVGADNSDTTRGTIVLKSDGAEFSDTYLPVGTTVVAYADCAEGFDLKNWYVNGKSVLENDDFVIDMSKCTLTFTTKSGGYYDISAQFYSVGMVMVSYEDDELGSVSAYIGDEAIASGDEVIIDSSVTFVATPDKFCHIKAWYVDGVLIDTSESTLTVDNLNQDIDVRVEFEAKMRTVTVNPFEGGTLSITLNGEEVEGDVITMTSIDTLIIQPTAEDDYSFMGWQGDVTATRGNACVIMPGLGDVEVTPIFTAIPNHTVTIYTNSYQNGGGSVLCGTLVVEMSSSNTVNVIDGKALVLTAVSDTGSYLYSWTVEGADFVEDGDTLILQNITGDVTVTAKFRRTDEYLVTYPTDTENGSINAAYSLTVGGQTLQGELTGNDYVKAGADVVFTINCEEGYIPVSLTANGNNIEFAFDETINAFTGTLKTVMEDTAIEIAFDTFDSHSVITLNTFTEMVEIPVDEPESGDGTESGEPVEPEYEEITMGSIVLSFVADGASVMDENAEEGTTSALIANGGTAIITLNSAPGYQISVYKLRKQIAKIISLSDSKAEAEYIVNDKSVVITITGVDTDLDFTDMISPFESTEIEDDVYYTVTIEQPVGGNVSVTWDSAYVENGAKVPCDALLIISAAADEHYKLEGLTSNGETNLGSAVVSGDITISAIFTSQHEYTPTVVVAPTCTTQGYTIYNCICGDSYIDDYTELLPHSFTNYISDGNATAYSNGTKTAKCNHCSATHTIIDEVSLVYTDAGKTDISVECTVGFSSMDNDYLLDISDSVIITAGNYEASGGEFDSSLDMTFTQEGDEAPSPYDLYWNAYNALSPSNYFTIQYVFDMAKVDDVFEQLSKALGYKVTYENDFELLEGILYNSEGNGLAVAQYIYKIAQRGDANLDNYAIDAKDAALVAKYSAQMASIASGEEEPVLSQTENELALLAADANCDGTIDAKDAAMIAKFSSYNATYSSEIADAVKYYEIWAQIG